MPLALLACLERLDQDEVDFEINPVVILIDIGGLVIVAGCPNTLAMPDPDIGPL